jgi:hypothetical protein
LNTKSLENQLGCKSACNLVKIESCSSNILRRSLSSGGVIRIV